MRSGHIPSIYSVIAAPDRMFVDQSVGAAITMFMQGTQKERPLTHDLLANVLRALGAKIDKGSVNDLKDGTYFARLNLFVILGISLFASTKR